MIAKTFLFSMQNITYCTVHLRERRAETRPSQSSTGSGANCTVILRERPLAPEVTGSQRERRRDAEPQPDPVPGFDRLSLAPELASAQAELESLKAAASGDAAEAAEVHGKLAELEQQRSAIHVPPGIVQPAE